MSCCTISAVPGAEAKADSLRSAGYTPEQVGLVLITHLHADHVGGLTSHDGDRVFPNAEVYVAKAESDFWLSPEIAAKAPKDAQPFFQSAAGACRSGYIEKEFWKGEDLWRLYAEQQAEIPYVGGRYLRVLLRMTLDRPLTSDGPSEIRFSVLASLSPSIFGALLGVTNDATSGRAQ